MQNPEEERARYQHDTDRNMTLLKFVQEDGAVSVLNWFAVHPTSLTYDNKFVSGDHKAFAALEMERRLAQSSRTPFVAAFANANCGDVTSNLNLDNTGPGTDDLHRNKARSLPGRPAGDPLRCGTGRGARDGLRRRIFGQGGPGAGPRGRL